MKFGSARFEQGVGGEMITPRYPFRTTADSSIGALANAAPTPAPGDGDPEARDNYLAKLVKYVPAPVIAIFVPAWEALNTKNQQWFVFLAFGIVGTLGWLFLAHLADKKATGRGTPAWFFILGVLSFGCWAIGTTDAGQQLTPILGVKIDDTWSWLILLTGAFFIPLADELLTIWTGNAKVPPGTPPAPPA